jgi:hypothetical protein
MNADKETMDLLTPEEHSQLFRILDNYARVQHSAFLTELFPNREKTEYWLCFRPLEVEGSLSERYDCRYLHITIAEVKNVIGTKALTAVLVEELDRELGAMKEGRDPSRCSG